MELKSEEEIAALRVSGHLAAELLRAVCVEIKIGVKTKDLDQLAERWIKAHDAKPAFLNYRGFPATICVSINEEVVHGIPCDRKIRDGDIVSVDVGLFYNGWCGDTARTVPVGNVTPEALKLLQVSEHALEESIRSAQTGKRLGDVSYAIQSVAEGAGFSVVRGYGGHGVGRAMHEDPHIPCFGKPDSGIRLKEGMVLAIEAMINSGTDRIVHQKDGWTVKTEDGAPSAHFEHMVAIRSSGTEILTRI